MNHVTNEFKNSKLARTSFKDAKAMLISTGVLVVVMIIAFVQHY